jgi:CelD/BcsL family acetyltransferase involved in cellulose biosynthesis
MTVAPSTGSRPSDAAVLVGPPDSALLRELPGLYGSLPSTEAWFTIMSDAKPAAVCVLEHPRHVLVLAGRGDTVDVLNKDFEITPADARRACEAIFADLPKVRRIHLEVPVSPEELSFPTRVLQVKDSMVVELPPSVDEYTAALGKRTRKNLRNYQNKLRRDYPDAQTTAVRRTAVELRAITELHMAWSIARMRARGERSTFETEPTRRAKFVAFLARGDVETLETVIGGRLAAVEFIYYVGRDATVYAGSFDRAYAEYHLGFVSTYRAVCRTLEEGASRCHLLWTSGFYKERLGAQAVRLTKLSVFRSEADRRRHLAEALSRDLYHIKDVAHAKYMRMRHRLELSVRRD